jgi:two-component system LytT family response regulator
MESRGEESVVAAPRRIAVRRHEKVVYVDVAEIDWVEAAGNYVVIHCGTHSDILRETLGDIEKQLPSDRFVRLSRSALVRITFIREISGVGTDNHVAIGATGCEWKVTRNLREIDRILRGGS